MNWRSAGSFLVWTGLLAAVCGGWFGIARVSMRDRCLALGSGACDAPAAAWLVLGAGVFVMVMGIALVIAAGPSDPVVDDDVTTNP